MRKLEKVEDLNLATARPNPETSLMRRIVNIALIGFMGAGKTSVAKLVAGQLHFDCLDTDDCIQAATGKTVAEIFESDGEAAFRALEEKTVRELEGRTRTVISAGGGLPVNPKNLASLKTHALVVCLWASPEKIWERVKNQAHRPLLNHEDPQEKIRELLAARRPFYTQADILLNTEARPLRAVADQVVHQFLLQTAGK
ncbi:MAG: shikimate kinase [Verrucomicrobia bacterium]|nr:shikimate kinase [Verrucomicrobiota bacterium]MDE3099238.1 shikimate kinase [Verrucomicrobiota bacterium]